jgi:hypothetical protein
MTRQFQHSRIRKNHLGIHKDPCAAFNAGVNLRESADVTNAKKYGPKSNGNDAIEWKEACAAIDEIHRPKAKQTNETHEPNSSNSSFVSSFWPHLDDAALHGLAGDVVRTIGPHSEADPVAILIQFLAAAGNILGKTYYVRREGDLHRGNLFVAVVGETAKARKGVAWGRVKSIVKIADDAWFHAKTKGGLSLGEGFVYEIRDPIKKWNTSSQDYDVVDPGVTDKRLLVVEAEFSNALTVMERAGNTLSAQVMGRRQSRNDD